MNNTISRFILLVLCLTLTFSAFGQTQKKRRRAERFDTGSFVGFSAGMGVGAVGYSLEGGSVLPLPSAIIAADYLYYFTSSIGISSGLHFSYLGSTAIPREPLLYSNLIDYEGQIFDHTIQFNDWRERQHFVLMEVPLLFQYKHKPWQRGWFASLGVKLLLPLSTTFSHIRGGITNTAYYPLWNLTLHDVLERFEQVGYQHYADRIAGLSKIGVTGYAEVGGLWQLDKRIDLRVSAYADVCMNNLSKNRLADKPRLGFAGMGNQAYDYMNTYDGLLSTSSVGNIHPWAVGVKAGITLYCGLTEQQKKKKVREFLRTYDQYISKDTIVIRDTVFIQHNDTIHTERIVEQLVELRDTIVLHDTITLIERQTKAEVERLDSLLSEAVIWFRFDEYEPILEPADVLDHVAAALIKNPRLRVHVNGHACDIGPDTYNRRLAMYRARAVADILRSMGVDDSQIEVCSFGSDVPFKYNKTHQRAKNRRVEVIPYF